MNNLAVTGVGGGVGQSILRALDLSQLSCRIIGFDMNPWSTGLYVCQRGYILPPAHDGLYIECLLKELINERVQILIPGSDPELPILAAVRKRLLSLGIMPIVGSPEAIRLCRDKLATYRFFHKHGLPFVRTVPCQDGLKLAEEVGFPLVVKPLGGSASRNVAIVFDKDELSRYVNQEGMIVQEYLVHQGLRKKREELTKQDLFQEGILLQEEEISIQILFDHEGNFLGKFASRNVLKLGVPLLIDPFSNAALEDTAFEMASLLVDKGHIGPCNLQCKLTERGPLFFEVNPRFTGITAVRASMGFNEVEAILRRALYNEPIVTVQKGLRVQKDLICSRYITEMILPRVELEKIKKNDFR